ncbi:cytosine deaminase [Annulohypoxylon maeteangense]|uniref:cytosine deaminase n=1 Tax=Annulohypoxylon maeteangense TaxID=1927788 RepID=UPI002007DB7E|nr:cytosine deaminase [Annulohypoxylon maeteangense]KAI0884808.1 cytosine deaminase [Annulohypoxylon maeteangense]
MWLSLLLQVVLLYFSPVFCHDDHHFHSRSHQTLISDPTLSINGVSFSTRAYWMRQANLALGKPCPYAAFGAVVVNHTGGSGLGELVCTGANSGSSTGNPTLHGEMSAIDNCSRILTDPSGPYKLSPSEAIAAFPSLTLYTNAESCPMCASAIRWAGFREYVYGTTIDALIAKGWGQIRISSVEVFRQSFDLSHSSRLIAGVLTNETDPYFFWQNDPTYPCPKGCSRVGGTCQAD